MCLCLTWNVKRPSLSPGVLGEHSAPRLPRVRTLCPIAAFQIILELLYSAIRFRTQSVVMGVLPVLHSLLSMGGLWETHGHLWSTGNFVLENGCDLNVSLFFRIPSPIVLISQVQPFPFSTFRNYTAPYIVVVQENIFFCWLFKRFLVCTWKHRGSK